MADTLVIEVISRYTDEQVRYVEQAYRDAITHWNLNLNNPEDAAEAKRQEKEARDAWMVLGVGFEIFGNNSEYNELFDAVSARMAA